MVRGQVLILWPISSKCLIRERRKVNESALENQLMRDPKLISCYSELKVKYNLFDRSQQAVSDMPENSIQFIFFMTYKFRNTQSAISFYIRKCNP
jgi:hypothetical protein